MGSPGEFGRHLHQSDNGAAAARTMLISLNGTDIPCQHMLHKGLIHPPCGVIVIEMAQIAAYH
jgi:hypothetical protein